MLIVCGSFRGIISEAFELVAFVFVRGCGAVSGDLFRR